MVTLVPPAVGPADGLRLRTVGTGAYVNTSPLTAAEVPAEEVTCTSTAPVPAGLTALTDVAEMLVTAVPGTPPKVTPVVPDRAVPVMVTVVPPATGPLVGAIEVTAGMTAKAAVLVPRMVAVAATTTIEAPAASRLCSATRVPGLCLVPSVLTTSLLAK
jgi:hypothetical protein